MELYKTTARSTLGAGIDASVTELVVDEVLKFPGRGQFRILIDSELMLVTSVAAGIFTVTRGIEDTTAASHLIGAVVTNVITAVTLDNLNRYTSPAPTPGLYTFRDLALVLDPCLYAVDVQALGELEITLNSRAKLTRVLASEVTNVVGATTGPIITITYNPQNHTPKVIIHYHVETSAAFTNIQVKEDVGPTTIYQHDFDTVKNISGVCYFSPGAGSKTYSLNLVTASALTIKKATFVVEVLTSDHQTSTELSSSDGLGEGRGDINTDGE